MPKRDVSRKPLTLTLELDDTLLTQLEQLAEQHQMSVDDWVRYAIQQTASRESPRPPRKNRSGAVRHDEAPLDAFLPEGVDPFAPVDGVSGLASNFEEIQARMRFAGTPALLRDWA